MSKDEKVVIGLLGVSLIGLGTVIGGVITRKIDSKSENRSKQIWIEMTDTFKDLLLQSYEDNDKLKKQNEKLKKQLESKKAK